MFISDVLSFLTSWGLFTLSNTGEYCPAEKAEGTVRASIKAVVTAILFSFIKSPLFTSLEDYNN